MDVHVLLTGLLIFLARICDVSIGTVRTIMTVQGRTAIAFCLATVEITIWLLVAGTVINQIREQPIWVVFYACGYATGNAIGIQVEKKLAFGLMILKVLTRHYGNEMTETLRRMGQPVTVFEGQGRHGPVNELYIACRRRDLKWILPEVKHIDPRAFYVIEQARDISRVTRPVMTPLGGWRAAGKRK